MMRVCVVGLGWMGLPIAALLSEGGNEVIGLDIDLLMVERVNRLDLRRNEPQLLEMLKRWPIKATTKPEEAIPNADAIVVIVPLVTNDDKSIGYGVMDSAVSTIARHMKSGALVVVQTTMPIGACRKRVAPILAKSGKRFLLAYAPIRAMAGTAIADMRQKYPRVVGALDSESMRQAEALLQTFFRNRLFEMTLEEAEATKLYEVIYRDVNIALANELGMISEELGLDYNLIKDAANSCGFYHLHDAGIGVGGHCLPVYPYLLLNEAKKDYGLIRKAREINDSMPRHAFELVMRHKPQTVTIFGIAYLKDTSEHRFSPAIELARLLKAEGIKVRVCDPNIDSRVLARWGEPVEIEDGLKSDVLVFAVGHFEFRGLESRIPANAAVIDSRGVLDGSKVKGEYVMIGRGAK